MLPLLEYWWSAESNWSPALIAHYQSKFSTNILWQKVALETGQGWQKVATHTWVVIGQISNKLGGGNCDLDIKHLHLLQ